MKASNVETDMDAFAYELFGEDDRDSRGDRLDEGDPLDEEALEADWLEEARASFDGLDRLTFRLPAAPSHRA
jgi:hypothetical protein